MKFFSQMWGKRVLTTLVWIVFGALAFSFIQTKFFDTPKQNTLFADPQFSKEDFSKRFEDVAAQYNPMVVSVFSETVVKSPSFSSDQFRDFFGDDFFRRFFGDQPAPQGKGRGKEPEREYRQKGLGSGVIISSDGYIVTNNHVVQDASEITVGLQNDKKYKAKVIGTDPLTDIAVIKIEENNLQYARWGDSDVLRVGQWVLAIGNPFQLMHTVTAGIISAKGRAGMGITQYEDFLQTDAAINPGNSGGALVTLDGELIGINTAIFTETRGYMGVGFAVPSNIAKRITESLINKGKVSRGYLGVYIQNIDENLGKALGLKDTKGAMVTTVTEGTPGDKAGIKVSDVIIEVNGKAVGSTSELMNAVAAIEPGSRIPVKLLREGKEMTVFALLGERPLEQGEKGTEEKPSKEDRMTKSGFDITELTPEIAKQLGIKGEKGIVVSNVDDGSPAEDAGLFKGDLIVDLDKKPVTSVSEFRRILNESKNDVAVLRVVRVVDNAGRTGYFFIGVPLKEQ